MFDRFAHRPARFVLLTAIAMLCALALAPTASAELRSPRLASQCSTGYEYGEIRNGPWRVEGCKKDANTKSGESRRVSFLGSVEVNGLLIEGAQEIFATESRPVVNAARTAIAAGEVTTYRVFSRGRAQIKVDYASGSTRKKDQLYSGRVDLSYGTRDSLSAKKRVPFDIPVSSNAEIMGMRVRETITGAKTNRGSENPIADPSVGIGPGTVVQIGATAPSEPSVIKTETDFTAVVSMGAGSSALLRDWSTETKFKLIDGKGLVVDEARGGKTPKFKMSEIVIPGVGGFKGLSITYDPATNTWTGKVGLDMGELFPTIDFTIILDGDTGVPIRIEAAVTGLTIPIGNTGVTLREVGGFFEPNPLVFGANIGATYGPKIGNHYVAEITGGLVISLEPNFRLEVDGAVRLLPTGPNNELGRGSSKLILDSAGFFSVSADARVTVEFAGVGARAQVRGSGAISTARSKFNIEASLEGELILGFLGDFEVARLEAVVSHKGWGTCGSVANLIKGGVGQVWGQNIDLMLSCDLSRYRANVTAAAAAAGQKAFVVPRGTSLINVELTGAGPNPRAVLRNPAGQVAATTFPLGRREIGNNVSVIAMPGELKQVVGIRNPAPGIWRVAWGDESPAIVDIRTARDIEPIGGDVDVGKQSGNGQRRIAIANLRNLEDDERVQIGVRTPNGIIPLGDATGRRISESFTDTDAGNREIVAMVTKNGIPNPARTRVLGRFASKVPGGANKLAAKRRKSRLTVSAKVRKGALTPSRWVFVVRLKGRPILVKRVRSGKSASFKLPNRAIGKRAKSLSVAAYPIVAGRVLKTRPKTVRVR